jgi:hypothetical protein
VAPAAARVAAVPVEAMGLMVRSSFLATRPKPDRYTLATLKGEGIREQKSEFLSSASLHEFDIDFLGN